MKTSVKTLTTICTVIISLSALAQRSHNNQNTVPQTQTQPAQNSTQTDRRGWASNGNSSANWGGSVNIHVGGFSNNYSNYGYYNSNNYYKVKKAARNSIHQSAAVIGQALQFSDWNDTYSPWLAKAIRHQQYARDLYFWGDYAGALNHAERAGFLAWNTLNYFNGYSNYNSGYPNPYSDPNNPYYRQGNTNTGSNDGSGYRKTQSGNDDGSTERKTQPEQKIAKAELDNSLPQSKVSDKELLKMNVKDLDVD